MSKAELIWRDASIAVPERRHDWSYNVDNARLARREQRDRDRKAARIALLRARLAVLAAS